MPSISCPGKIRTRTTVQTEFGPRLVDHIRNNNRVLFKDIEFARELWTDLEPFAPAEIGDSVAIALNELFSIL